MSDDSLTARNRINQRNFRARRQNYIKELEERIRKYESDGVQATIEIQAAARQVTDQNIKLRNLLVQRFGMSDHEITKYLGHPQQNVLPNSPQLLNNPGSNSHLANLAPAPAGTLTTKQMTSTELLHSYPTPPQQSDPPRTLRTAHLDPALSLANLHKYPSMNQDAGSFTELSLSRQSSDLSTIQSASTIKSSSYDNTRPPDSPTDTLSEPSNPTTPAEQIHTDNPPRPGHSTINNLLHQPAPLSDLSGGPHPAPSGTQTAKRALRPNDETTCEEAARIIASMRGGTDTNNPDQVMLELGCTGPGASCNVKNVNIFQLLDRA